MSDAAHVALPEAAGRRLGQTAWSSGLSIVDFASCHALGMEPVALVQGFSVMQWAWMSAYSYRQLAGPPSPSGRGQYSKQWRCPHAFVSVEHRSWGVNFEQTWLEQNWSTGFGLAYGRMVEEATEAGAHGIIGVVDKMQHLGGSGVAEFRIQGTAVTIPGAPKPERPFTTFLAGQRLTKLLEAGFVPVSVVASLASVQMIGYCVTHYQLSGMAGTAWAGSMTGVQPIPQVEEAQRSARALARDHARSQLGGDVLHGVDLESFEHEVGEGDLAIQCVLRGNRVRQFKDFDPLDPPEPVVRLR